MQIDTCPQPVNLIYLGLVKQVIHSPSIFPYGTAAGFTWPPARRGYTFPAGGFGIATGGGAPPAGGFGTATGGRAPPAGGFWG